MTVVSEPSSREECVIHIGGSLRVPVDRDLRHSVRALLGLGKRCIVVDLARLQSIDAAGVGELVHAFNMARAARGALRIVHASGWVRTMLECVRLFDLLTYRPEPAGAVATRAKRLPSRAVVGDSRRFGVVHPACPRG